MARCLIFISLALMGIFVYHLKVNVVLPSVSLKQTLPKGRRLRDCSLVGLARHLNRYSKWEGLAAKDTAAISEFVKHMAPAIGEEPDPQWSHEAMEALRPEFAAPDCRERRYSHMFTGRPLAKPRVIVDIIPFGYAFEFLELRLLEYGDIVDLFVISESERSEKPNHTKALYFDQVKEQPRFARYRHKILHLVRKTTSALRKTLGRWSLEVRTRSYPTLCLAALVFNASDCGRTPGVGSRRMEQSDVCGFCEDENGPRHAIGSWGLPEEALSIVRAGRHDAFVLQNDEDELLTRQPLSMLRACELRDAQETIYAPTLLQKVNAKWLRATDDMVCLPGGGAEYKEYKSHLWRMGVNLKRLQPVACEGTTNSLRRDLPCNHASKNFPFGVATHLSSMADPVWQFMKNYYVLEFSHASDYPSDFIAAGRARNITSGLLVRMALRRACSNFKGGSLKHVDSTNNVTRDLVKASMPWALKAAPERFCFLAGTTSTAAWDPESLATLSRADFGRRCAEL